MSASDIGAVLVLFVILPFALCGGARSGSVMVFVHIFSARFPPSQSIPIRGMTDPLSFYTLYISFHLLSLFCVGDTRRFTYFHIGDSAGFPVPWCSERVLCHRLVCVGTLIGISVRTVFRPIFGPDLCVSSHRPLFPRRFLESTLFYFCYANSCDIYICCFFDGSCFVLSSFALSHFYALKC